MTIIYFMAAPAEYGPHLRRRIDPVMIGIGPVEAAVNTTRALAACSGVLPKLAVCLGSAGSRVLEQCAVYQASSVSYRDMDASPLGFPKGQTPLLDLPPVLQLPTIRALPTATLSTGGAVISGGVYDGIEAEMVDMETYAVLRACQAFGVPLLALRGISDGVAELRELKDWTQYLYIIDERLAAAIDLVEAAVSAGEV